jgi:hypothetical protein
MYCHIFGAATIKQVMEWMIGLIDTLCTQLVTACNYSVAANLRTLQFTVRHTLVSSVYYSLH